MGLERGMKENEKTTREGGQRDEVRGAEKAGERERSVLSTANECMEIKRKEETCIHSIKE